MQNKLLALIRQYDMVQKGDTLVCALSGGADSVALLWAMYLLRDKLGFCLEAAHFNHRLRGEESERDEQFVRALCDRYSIPLHVGSGTVTPGEKGLEAAAREARYAYLLGLNGKIATAHTADDNAETVLMHMVRGTGLNGLGGIAPVRGKLIRPMLTVTRREVLAFLQEYHLSHVTDSSNAGDLFLRNRLRHRVMPWLAGENPQFAKNVSAMALRLRSDEQQLAALAEADMTTDVHALRQLPEARRSRVLGLLLERFGVKEPDAAHIALLDAVVHSENPSAKADFPGSITVGRNYDRLEKQAVSQTFCEKLPCPGCLAIPGLAITVTAAQAQSPCAEKTRFTVHPVGEIVVRSRKAGDTLRLSGGTKSLKKLFIDAKIPASRRTQIPVVADDRGILGVYGFGADLDRLSREAEGVEICFTEN